MLVLSVLFRSADPHARPRVHQAASHIYRWYRWPALNEEVIHARPKPCAKKHPCQTPPATPQATESLFNVAKTHGINLTSLETEYCFNVEVEVAEGGACQLCVFARAHPRPPALAPARPCVQACVRTRVYSARVQCVAAGSA